MATYKPRLNILRQLLSRTKLSVPKAKTKFDEKSISFFGPNRQNSLLRVLRENDSIENFKQKLKTHLFTLFFLTVFQHGCMFRREEKNREDE